MFNGFSHLKNVNHNDLEIPSYTFRMTRINNTSDSTCWRGVGIKGTLLNCRWVCKLIQPLWKSVCQDPKKLGIHLSPDPAIPFLGIYPKGCLILPHRHLLNHAQSCSIYGSQNWKRPTCSSTEGWIKCVTFIQWSIIQMFKNNSSIMKIRAKGWN